MKHSRNRRKSNDVIVLLTDMLRSKKMFLEMKIKQNIFYRAFRRLGIGKTHFPDSNFHKHMSSGQVEAANLSCTQQFEQAENSQQVENPQKAGQVILKSIRFFAEQGNWIKLAEKGHELLLYHASERDALELVAYSLQQGGQLAQAAEIAQQAAKIYPDHWMFNFVAGISLKGIGREKDACGYLRQALAIAPNDQQTLRLLTEATAVADGIERAASLYTAHCLQIEKVADIVLAPVSTVRSWAKKTGLVLLEAGEVEEIPFKAPHVWGSPPATEVNIVLSDKPYVADIKDARIFGNSSLVLTSDGTVLNDTAAHPRFGRYVNHAYEKVVLAQEPQQLLLSFSELTTREIEAGIFLSGLASDAYGHWLPEFLPKLQFLQQHPEFADLPLIVDAGMPQSHFDHLSRLANNPLILLQPNESLLCKRLLMAPSPAFFPVELFPHDIPVQEMPGLSPKAMRFLRGDESYKKATIGHRRLFLARKNMKWRRLINEDEIAADLSQLGFEIIFTEEMTVAEQIDLFQEAQWIVAPNGSALLNLIFSNTSTRLLVLMQPNLFNWGTFQGPMDALGYQSLCVCGDYALAEKQKHSDYHIPVQRIRDALSWLGMSTLEEEIEK